MPQEEILFTGCFFNDSAYGFDDVDPVGLNMAQGILVSKLPVMYAVRNMNCKAFLYWAEQKFLLFDPTQNSPYIYIDTSNISRTTKSPKHISQSSMAPFLQTHVLYDRYMLYYVELQGGHFYYHHCRQRECVESCNQRSVICFQ